MIGPAPELSSVLGATPPKINNSDMKSYGFELELGWRDMIGDFSYGAKFTLADDQQKTLAIRMKTTNFPKHIIRE